MTVDPADLTCEAARAALTGDLAAATVTACEAAKVHVARCPACRVRLEQLARAVLSGRDDEIPCAECQDGLVGYLSALADGVNVVAAFPLVHRHRQACHTCTEVELALRLSLGLLDGASLPAPRAVPVFDLTFMTRPCLA